MLDAGLWMLDNVWNELFIQYQGSSIQHRSVSSKGTLTPLMYRFEAALR